MDIRQHGGRVVVTMGRAARELLTHDEARTLANELLDAAQAAEERDRSDRAAYVAARQGAPCPHTGAARTLVAGVWVCACGTVL